MVVLDNRSQKNNLPFFTIITVVRNGALTLQRCINSVASQTFGDFEYLVIDGASTDKTLEIARDNSNSIDLLISEEDKGLYFAMNKGIEYSRGRYIGILNADDIYFPDTLQLVWNLLKQSPESSVVYGAIEYSSSPGRALFIHIDELPQHMIYHPTCFVSRDAYARHGLFNTKYRVAADYDLMYRLAKGNEKFLGTGLSLAIFAEGGTSAKLRFRSILETSEIQAKYNLESKIKRIIKLIRTLTFTYARVAIRQTIYWFTRIARKRVR